MNQLKLVFVHAYIKVVNYLIINQHTMYD